MANQGISLRAAIRSLVEEMARELDGHPEPEEFLAYHECQVSGQEANRLREHLSLCPSCCSLLLWLKGFPEPEQERDASETAELEAAWRRLQERLQEGVAASPSPAPRLPRMQKWNPLSATLAASLLLACLSLGILARAHDVREKAEATAKVLVVDLVPEGETTRGADGADSASVRLSPGFQRLVLLLHLLEADTFSSYKVVLMDGPGAGWSDAELKPDQDGNFVVDVPREWLPPIGPLRICLYGQEDGQEELVAVYRTRIE